MHEAHTGKSKKKPQQHSTYSSSTREEEREERVCEKLNLAKLET